MHRLARRVAVAAVLAAATAAGPATSVAGAASKAKPKLTFQEYKLSEKAMSTLRQRHYDQLERKYGRGNWAPMRMELSNADLKLMGLPPKRVLTKMRFSKPTMVDRRGNREAAPLPTVATFAGAGYFGIRPGAWVLLISGGSVGWCSLAHVYGAPGSYAASTAGHCGKAGDIATVIAAYGNRAGALEPVLLDFGAFKTSRDGGVGDDWALIPVRTAYQSLVTPTMAFWGGPRGSYTKSGTPVGVTIPRNGLIPGITVTPDPLLAQPIVHYGHGTGVGAGGTPRAGTALHWGARHFMFFGAISPGDSGSGSNTLGGDTIGAVNEAAGINTHLYVDPLMRQGLGVMAGTRVTQVSGTLANGQLVGYPAPVPLLP